jgi:hypothetical protein
VTRAYLRLDPDLLDHKVSYPDGAFRAFVETLCLAEQQPRRGTFKNERLLRVLLERRARWVPYLIEHEDLIPRSDGSFYVDGWDEWQEGDWKVHERVGRIRGRHGALVEDRTPGAIRTANWRLRNAVFERDAYTCRYCGNGSYPRDWLILEHVEPKGPTTEENLVTACRPCNKLKGDRNPLQAGMPLRDVSLSDASPNPVTLHGGKRLAVSGGGKQTNGVTPHLTEEERTEAIAHNRSLIEETQDPAIARAARKALEKLGAQP